MGALGSLIILLLVAIPVAKILDRAGFSKLWALLVVVPLVNIFALWVLAYSQWPNDKKGDGMIDITPPGRD